MRKYLYIILVVGLLFSGTAFAGSYTERQIVVDKVDTQSAALVAERQIMIPVETLQEHVDFGVRFDPAEKRVYVNCFLPKFRLETPELNKLIFPFGVELNFPAAKINDKFYVNIYGLEKILGIYIKQGEKVLDIKTRQYTFFSPAQLNTVRKSQAFNGKINLVWDHILDKPVDLAAQKAVTGLDVIAPTWFAVVNGDGLVASKADIKYVQDAHDKGYKVWALVSNSFDRDLTREVLNSERAKRNIIRQLVVYSSLYNLDGINIDFENIYDDDRDKLTEFVRQLTEALKEQNVTVSIDVTVVSASPYWSACYDRRRLGEIVDYVMVMTYDEHWRMSPVSGSVASLGWVDKGISKMLEYVPKEKLLMGIPFYTREWEERIENDKLKVSSRALSMQQAEDIVSKQQIKPVWLADKGQFYAEYQKDGGRYRIWLENADSIKLKAGLVHKYDLAGAASWRKGFEKDEIWDVLNSVLKEGK